MEIYKYPESVLVVVFNIQNGRVLMLQRRDDPDFWQSITGSLEKDEAPLEAAVREIKEEIGIDLEQEKLTLIDCQHSVEFEIFPHFRHRYAPEVTHNVEHWYCLALPAEREIILSEHHAYQWMLPVDAMALTKSWSNRQAIKENMIST